MEKELFYKFFDGKATPEERARLKAWLGQSPEREEELLREREFFDAVLLSDPQKEAAERRGKRHTLWRKAAVELLKVAALLAIALGCGWQWHRAEMRKLSEKENLVRVPAGQQVNLTLPDGTHVWLNARSEMRYPALFTEGSRSVRLEGEAYFEVTRDVENPFVVRTDKGQVEVLGTKFNVEAYPNEPVFRTSLLEGAVRVSLKDPAAGAITLAPNYEALLTDGQLETRPITDYDGLRWREGLICFRNTGFAELMTRFERCYGIRIVVENRRLDDYVCSGKFRISDGIDRALMLLQRDVRFRIERSRDEGTIYIR